MHDLFGTFSRAQQFEDDDDDDDDEDDDDDGGSEGSAPTEEAGGNTLLDVDDEEAFMDRRRISADAQLSVDGSDSEMPDGLKVRDIDWLVC